MNSSVTISQIELPEQVEKEGLGLEEARVLIELLMGLESHTNRVIIGEGNPITFSELSELTELDEGVVIKTLDSLEKKGYIGVLEVDGVVEIYCNPYLFVSGEFTNSDLSWYFSDYYSNKN